LWLVLAAVPITADFALGWLGLVHNTALSRSLTGALFGATAALYVMPGLVEAAIEVGRKLPGRGGLHGSKQAEIGAD
jgi:hypothetical protein